MKKYLTIAVAVALVGALSLGVLGLGNVITNKNMDKVISQIDGVGKDFLKSTAKPKDKAGSEFDAAMDDDDSTAWTAAENTGAYLQKDFKELTTVNCVSLKEVGSNTRKFHIEAWNGKEWVQVYSNDLIESFHQCVLEKTIMTYSVRVVFDKMKDSSVLPQISTMDAYYQAPMGLDNEFINMAYMTDCSYFHDWDPIVPEKMDGFTDVTIIGNWVFDADGKFQLSLPIVGPGGFDKAVDPNSAEGKAFTEKAFSTVKSYYGKKVPNLWLSITCLKETKNGDGSPANGAPHGQTDIFLDDAIRAQFIKDVIAYAKENGIYGIDIDWEYPATASQWKAYGKLIEDFAVALHKEGMYMSTAQSLGTGLTPAQLNLFDRVNIMSYDNVGGIDGQHSTFEFSVNKTIKTFVNDLGIDRSKIVLGLPWYADKLHDSTVQTDWKTIHGLLLLASEDGENIDPGINKIKSWSFNGPNLLRDKTVYALQNKLGGVFCWQIKNDIEYSHKDSLAKTVNETIEQFSFVK